MTVTTSEVLREVRKRRGLKPLPIVTVSPEREKQLVMFYANYLTHHGYDERNPEVSKCLAYLMARMFSGTIRKGILLHGCTGSGKTIGMRLVQEYFRMRWHDAVTVARWGRDAATMAKHLSYPKQHDWQRPQDVVLDDVGDDETLVDYGNRCEPVADYIMARYRLFIERRALTHVLTNLKEAELIARYGERVVSRLNEMCAFVDAGTTDWRRKAQ